MPNSSALRFVLVGAELVLGARDWIVRPPLFIHSIAVRIAVLFVERRIAFDGALVNVGILLLLHRHRDHVRLLGERLSCRCYNRPMTERTLAIIKPDAVERHLTGTIIQRIDREGFHIRGMRLIRLTRGQAEGFYAVHRERGFFKSLTDFMSSGAAVVMVLEADDAIRKWRTLMGSTDPAKADANTLRKLHGESIERNATHGSDGVDLI
jgi:nucleoside-diphosphate kinase